MVSPDAIKVLKSLHISRCQFNDGVERGEVGQNVLVVHKHIVQLSLGLKDLLCGACTHVWRGRIQHIVRYMEQVLAEMRLKHAVTSYYFLDLVILN